MPLRSALNFLHAPLAALLNELARATSSTFLHAPLAALLNELARATSSTFLHALVALVFAPFPTSSAFGSAACRNEQHAHKSRYARRKINLTTAMLARRRTIELRLDRCTTLPNTTSPTTHANIVFFALTTVGNLAAKPGDSTVPSPTSEANARAWSSDRAPFVRTRARSTPVRALSTPTDHRA
jgi:hypothetical protein